MRPEATASMARMILLRQCEETGIGRTSPVPVTRWFSIPLCWRNETPQKGRKREFYQWNMDIIGVRAIYAECELISAIIAFYRSVGLTAEDVVIKLNSRNVMQAALKSLGVEQEATFLEVMRVIDKVGKPGQDIEGSLTALVGAEIAETLMKLIRCSSFEEFTALAGLDCEGDVLEFRELLEALQGSGDWLEYDPKIARGLEYYDGAVWESFARDSALFQRALCGGGRYNKLMGNLGSRVEVPAVGFGLGDKPIFELLAAKCLLPKELDVDPLADFGVVPFSPSAMAEVVRVADLLRAAGKRVVTCLEPQKARREGPLEYARRQGDIERARQWENRLNARRVVVVGAPDEQQLNLVRVLDLLGQPAAEWRVPIEGLQEVDSYLTAGPAVGGEADDDDSVCPACQGSQLLAPSLPDPCPVRS